MMRRGADMTLRPIRLVAVALVLGVFLAPAAPACRGQAAAPAVRATKAPAKTMRPVPATAPDLAQLDRDLAQALRDWQVPGMAVAIVKNGAVVHAKGYGVRELGKPGPVDANTLFAIASNSKAFTSAALAILADEGKITWDDRVVAHLPYFQAYDPWVTHEMRIRDLLSHRSGFGTFSGDLLWYGTPYSREEVIWREAASLNTACPAAVPRPSWRTSHFAMSPALEMMPAAAAAASHEYHGKGRGGP